MQLIQTIRRDGFAFDNEENELGVRCIAASLKSFHCNPKYAISVSAPKDRMTDERIASFEDIILGTKQKILSEMGQL